MKSILPLICLFFLSFFGSAQTSSIINVRLFGGSAPFSNSQWNNWNVGTAAFSTPVSSGLLRFANGTTSTVSAELSAQGGLADNGANYLPSASICPDSVLRFCSYITSARTLTIKGLDSTAKYNISLYSSRARNDSEVTKFTIGTLALTVATDSNGSAAANFTSITPSGTSITINISRVVLYNYLNGFTISKVGAVAPPTVSAGTNKTIVLPTNSVTLSGSVVAGSSAISKTLWTQVSGPSAASIQSPSSVTTVVSNLVQGTYSFKLTATDVNAQTASSTVTVTVNAATAAKKRIALLGSSTAAGFFNGLWPIDSSYAKQLMHYYQKSGVVDTLYNLAANGYNPYKAMPSWYSPDASLQPVDVYTYDGNRNINKALSLHPDVILLHFPTNAYDTLTIQQVMFAFRTIKAKADSAGIPVYILGTQPRGNLSIANKQKLITINDSLVRAFGSHAISYYDSVSTFPRSLYMKPSLLLDNDSIHMNPTGHDIIFRQILKANIFSAVTVTPTTAINAGANQTVRLPNTSVNLNGTTSGSPAATTFSWRELSGPNTATIQTPTSLQTTVSGLIAGVYSFRLAGTTSGGTTVADTVQVTVLSSTPPTADAGAALNVLLPASSATLSGKATQGTGGKITGFLWKEISGPNNASISSPGSATTTVTNLVEGNYTFRLTVTDSSGISAADSTTVFVTDANAINVQLYGGNAGIVNKTWNTWNIGTGTAPAASGAFHYANGNTTTVSASLEVQTSLADNGNGYAKNSVISPDSVLRFASAYTSSRVLTINGLDNTGIYTIGLLASRAGTSGQQTQFTSGNQSATISTDNNISSVATLSGLTPTNGSISISIGKLVTYNYLNAFIIKRTGTVPPPPVDTLNVQTYPNPFSNSLTIVNNGKNPIRIQLFNMSGFLVLQTDDYNQTLQIGTHKLRRGSYVLRITDLVTGTSLDKIVMKF